MLELAIKAYKEGKTRAETVKQVEHYLFELYKDPNLKEKREELSLNLVNNTTNTHIEEKPIKTKYIFSKLTLS